MDKLNNVLLNNEAEIKKILLQHIEDKRHMKIYSLKSHVAELDIITFSKIIMKYISFYTNKNDDLCKETIHRSCIPYFNYILEKVFSNDASLGLMISLIKCYKASYIKLISKDAEDFQNKEYVFILTDLFDEIEIESADKWCEYSEKKLKNKIQNYNKEVIEALKKRNDIYCLEQKDKTKEVNELMENHPDGIIIRNKDTIMFVNSQGAKLLGENKSSDIIGKKISDFITPYDCSNNLNSEKFYRNVNSLKKRYKRKCDGKIIDLESNISVYRKNNYEVTMHIFRDITKNVQLLELEKSCEEKIKLLNEKIKYDKVRTEFFANISHEFKTPINVILATLQLLDAKHEGEAHHTKENMIKYHKIMKQNCYRLIKLVNNLLDITKIDSGIYELQLTDADIVSTVEEITISINDYCKNKNISLIFDTDVEEKIMAFDVDKIQKTMYNLLSNAIKFTDNGGSIYVNVSDDINNIVISVKDTGIGIPEKKQKIIFDRFFQVDKSLSRNTEGSGIGLSLVKSIVEMHNGSISLSSSLGKGSEFIVRLPAYQLNKENNDESNKINNVESVAIDKAKIEFSDIYL